jgi:Ca2+-binding RTX toxin-like protein
MTILNAVGTIGNDSIAGGQNTDTITGGDGNDFIAGFAGVDVLDGGAGIDTFILYTTSTNNDAITFVVADDILGMDKTSSGAFTAPGAPVLVQTLAGNTDVANRVVVDTIANLGAAGVTLGNLSAYANTVNYAVAFDTGAIFYDADGDWTAGSIAVGDLSSTTALTAGNFVIV